MLITHFSASSHLEGKLFLALVKLNTGLPGVEGPSTLLCAGSPLLSVPPFEVGRDLTNSEVSLRLMLQSGSGSGSGKASATANGLLLLLLSYKLVALLLSIGDS